MLVAHTSDSMGLLCRCGALSSKLSWLTLNRPVFLCGGDLVADSGFIGSEGFPSFYKPNSRCTWRITVSHSPHFLPCCLCSVWVKHCLCLLSRSQRGTWSCSPSAFLTLKLTHSAATTIWMFTMAIPTWYRNWVAFVELSALELLFQLQTPWCWRWHLMGRHKGEALWPISVGPNHT